MREFLKGLELDSETIDTIMAEHGKLLTGLKEQVENYKNEVSGYKEQIEELNNTINENKNSLENLQTITDENKNLKAELQMNGSNVKKEFKDFVISKVQEGVNDETDFATSLENYKKDNPQYFGETVISKVQTSPNLNGGGTPTQTTNDIMNDILRGASQK
jgi:prefoldin subunit 5